MEDKTIITLAGMIILTVILALCLLMGHEDMTLRIALASSIVALVGVMVAYAWGKSGSEVVVKDQEGN